MLSAAPMSDATPSEARPRRSRERQPTRRPPRRDAPGHEGADRDRPDAGAPGDERKRRQPEPVDGPRQDAEHPEQARREGDRSGCRGAGSAVHPPRHGTGRATLAPVPCSLRATPEPDPGERDPELVEHLDRDEEPGEEEDDGEELGDRERRGDPEPVQAVAGRRDERSRRR